jgi:hypothetical protein
LSSGEGQREAGDSQNTQEDGSLASHLGLCSFPSEINGDDKEFVQESRPIFFQRVLGSDRQRSVSLRTIITNFGRHKTKDGKFALNSNCFAALSESQS